jgi:hypothetical protein
MELKDFIAATLREIVEGVSEAREYVKKLDNHASINPMRGSSTGQTYTPPQNVEFDVALTITTATGTKGGVGIAAGPIVLGSHGKNDKSDQVVNRIKFTVPVTLPQDEPRRGRSRRARVIGGQGGDHDPAMG